MGIPSMIRLGGRRSDAFQDAQLLQHSQRGCGWNLGMTETRRDKEGVDIGCRLGCRGAKASCGRILSM